MEALQDRGKSLEQRPFPGSGRIQKMEPPNVDYNTPMV